MPAMPPQVVRVEELTLGLGAVIFGVFIILFLFLLIFLAIIVICTFFVGGNISN